MLECFLQLLMSMLTLTHVADRQSQLFLVPYIVHPETNHCCTQTWVSVSDLCNALPYMSICAGAAQSIMKGLPAGFTLLCSLACKSCYV